MKTRGDPAAWPATTDYPPGPQTWRQAIRAHLPPAYTLVLAMIFAGSLVVAWAVLPGEDERIEALERDGQTSRAFALLEARFNRGDRRQRTLVNLRRFYDYYGNAGKSREVLELLAALRPRDLYVQRQLAQLYRLNQDMPGQIRALQAQLAIRYAEPICQRLIGLLHLTNDFAAEQATLIDCHNNGYRRPEGLERLASLYAADGKLDQTAQILAAVDDRRWLRGSHERLMLFDALMSTNRPQDALRRGVRWYKGQPDQDLALEMISRLVAAGRNDFGLQMARQVGTAGDPVTLAAGEILVDQVQFEAARAFLAGWLAQAREMSTETAIRFVAAAVDADDPLLAMRGAEQHGLARFQSSDLVPLAEGLIAAGRVAEFDKVRAQLTPDTIAADGLIAASIDLREGQLDAARAALAAVTIDETDERRMALKAHLVALAGRPPAATRLVRDPPQSVNLPGALPGALTVPPAIGAAPAGEPRVRRVSRPLEFARRLKKRRFGLRISPAAATTAPKQSQIPGFTPFNAPGQ